MLRSEGAFMVVLRCAWHGLQPVSIIMAHGVRATQQQARRCMEAVRRLEREPSWALLLAAVPAAADLAAVRRLVPSAEVSHRTMPVLACNPPTSTAAGRWTLWLGGYCDDY